MASLKCHCPCSRFSSSLSSSGPEFWTSRGRTAAGNLTVRPGKSLPYPSVPLACDSTSNGIVQNGDAFSKNGFEIHRREAVLMGIAAIFTATGSPLGAYAESAGATDMIQEERAATAVQVDVINAYSYFYPTNLGSKTQIALKWVESRKPERYSSAAPLAPDARQRIVSERIDFRNNVVVSVSVGPPNFMILKSTETTDWDAKDVAQSVLADKSTSRMTTGQRVAEISVLDSRTEERDGMRYWYYEYLTQKSPTVTQKGLDVFRHSVAVTAEREGYLYSLNASTLETNWEKMSSALKQSISSFQMLSVTEEYVPPYKDPWRFW